jgi:hypothetical protein
LEGRKEEKEDGIREKWGRGFASLDEHHHVVSDWMGVDEVDSTSVAQMVEQQ